MLPLILAAALSPFLPEVQVVCYPHADVENAYACVYTEVESGETFMQVCVDGTCGRMIRITQRPRPAKKHQV
jgi:hypothetical protein